MKKVYDAYTDAIFGRLNKLTAGEYERAVRDYGLLYDCFMPKDNRAKILDIGCGPGHFLGYLKSKGYANYHGIDISKQQVECCLQNVTTNVEQADALEYLNDKQELYDLIVMNDLLEHITKEQLMPFLELVHNSLTTAGFIIAKVPNMGNPFALRSRYIDITHHIGFTEESLYEVLKASGFNDISLYPIPARVTSPKAVLGKIAKIMIHRLIKFSYYVQGYNTVPKILTVNMIAVAKK